MKIFIVIDGEPVGKGRPRIDFQRRRVYPHKKTAEFEGVVRSYALRSMKGKKIMTGSVRLGFKAYHAIPKSWSKKKKEDAMAGLIEPTSKPDLSNLVKAVEDAMNGVVYADDAQITRFTNDTGKYYGVVPRVEIIVEGE